MHHKVYRKHASFSLKSAAIILCCSLAGASTARASTNMMLPTVVDPGYSVQSLMPRTPGNGFNGLAFDSQGTLYAGVVQGSAIYKIDKETGDASVFVPPPEGGADDLIFEPGGRVIWTAFFLGKVFARGADGKIVTLAENLPGVNSIARGRDGRVYVSQVFMGDAIWELDLSGKMKHRKVAERLGGLTAFRVHTDGFIYGPLWFRGQVVKIDPNSGKIVKVIADGFRIPVAVNFDSKGNLYVLDNKTGDVVNVDVNSGAKRTIVTLRPHLDNLAIDPHDRMFVSTNGDGSIFEIDAKTGKVRAVVEGHLACPQGVAVWNSPEGEILYVADNFSYKRVDGFTGDVRESTKGGAFPNSASITGDKVLMAGWFRNTIEVFDAKSDALLYAIPGFKAPFGMLMLKDGSILVTEGATGNLLRVRDREGRRREVVARDMASPVYIAPAGNDAVYVTEFLGGKVTRVDLNTGNKSTVASGLRGPKGIAVRPDGHLVVVNVGSRELVQIDPKTGIARTIAQNLAVGLAVPPGFLPAYTLTGVAISDAGNIYVTSDLDNVVYKFSPR